MTEVELLTTGPRLRGPGIRAIEPVIEQLIREARSDLHVVVYVFTPQSGRILTLLRDAAEKGVKLVLVVNQFERQNRIVRTRLRQLRNDLNNVILANFQDPRGRQLHAKVVVADRSRAVVGSANLSWGGMVSNYEIGVLVKGPFAWNLAKLIDSFTTKLQIL